MSDLDGKILARTGSFYKEGAAHEEPRRPEEEKITGLWSSRIMMLFSSGKLHQVCPLCRYLAKVTILLAI